MQAVKKKLHLSPLQKMWKFEHSLWSQGARRVAGIDEAGRGPLSGPVVAACCILSNDTLLDGVNDSKQLDEAQREALFDRIHQSPGVEFGVGIVEAAEIDRLNILGATFLAMHRALAQLESPPDLIIVDGSLAPSFGIPTLPIVKGDAQSASIAAASILAKVTRDRIMLALDEIYPQYGFREHKGYGTPEHLAAIEKFGPCAIHRKSFEPIKGLLRTISQIDLFSDIH